MRNVISTIVIAGAAACTPAEAGQPPHDPRDQLACYHRADQKAQARVDSECGGVISTCPLKDEIMDGLRSDQEACP